MSPCLCAARVWGSQGFQRDMIYGAELAMDFWEEHKSAPMLQEQDDAWQPCLRESFELKKNKSLNLQMLRRFSLSEWSLRWLCNWTEVETPESPEEPQRSFWEFYLWLQLSNSIKYLIDGTLVFSSTNVFVRINGPYHPLQLQSLY